MAKFYIDRVVSPLASDEDIVTSTDYSAEVIRHAAAIYEANDQSERAEHLRLLAQKKEESPTETAGENMEEPIEEPKE